MLFSMQWPIHLLIVKYELSVSKIIHAHKLAFA
jgi:hypothetical protein